MIFLYGDNLINWSVGQASSVHAQAGFNAGDGVRHYTVPGSRTSSIVNIETTSNIGVAGKYVFRVDEATIVTPPPGKSFLGIPTTIQNDYVHQLCSDATNNIIFTKFLNSSSW